MMDTDATMKGIRTKSLRYGHMMTISAPPENGGMRMPIKGALLILVVAMIWAIMNRNEIWSLLSETLSEDKSNENEKENKEV